MKFNRRIRVVWMLLVCMLLVAGCGGTPAADAASSAPAVSAKAAQDAVTPTPTPVAAQEAAQETAESEPAESEAEEGDAGSSDGAVEEIALSGTYETEEALYLALDIRLPDQLRYEMTSTGVDGTVAETVHYKKGESFRIESQSEGADLVTIYNADEGVTYSYDRNEGTGMRFADEDEAGDLNNDEDDLTFSDVDMVITSVSYDLYGGERVVYYEMQGEGISGKVWFSLRNGIPLRSESTYPEGTLISEVTRVSAEQNLDDSLFKPEEGIQFVDMDDLFGQFDMAGDLMQME